MPMIAVFAGSAALLVVVAFAARRRLAVVTVRGESMVPALRPGDRLLVLRGKAVRRGQIVVLEPIGPGMRWRDGPLPEVAAADWVVKRVAALPGEPVPPQCPGLPATVPPGKLVVLGDGEISADSRLWGLVPADRVLGVVLRTLVSTS
ncbi:S26 family signal peptidase [Nonomuraea sp. NPDC003560]|uniref:S26 family signal peptidase n=1 Tax=Nonomuraea sp. NPDC003560 TaxID=3364341 RepID=UPI0036BCEAF9